MNEKQFLTQVIKLYHQVRKPLFPNGKVRRGRSRSVASSVEDLFGAFLAERIHCDLIYVDQPISIEGYRAQIIPDIVVVKGQQVTALCDVKMDLGWKRNELYLFCQRHANLLTKIRGKKCKIRDGLTKEDRSYHIGRNVCLNIVIISDQNIGHEILDEHLRKVKRFRGLVRVFILTKGEHPNTYGVRIPELLERITIDKQAFDATVGALS